MQVNLNDKRIKKNNALMDKIFENTIWASLYIPNKSVKKRPLRNVEPMECNIVIAPKIDLERYVYVDSTQDRLSKRSSSVHVDIAEPKKRFVTIPELVSYLPDDLHDRIKQYGYGELLNTRYFDNYIVPDKDIVNAMLNSPKYIEQVGQIAYRLESENSFGDYTRESMIDAASREGFITFDWDSTLENVRFYINPVGTNKLIVGDDMLLFDSKKSAVNYYTDTATASLRERIDFYNAEIDKFQEQIDKITKKFS